MSTTYLAKKGEPVHKWHVVDAKGQVLGRLAAKLATIAMGKHKPTYTPAYRERRLRHRSERGQNSSSPARRPKSFSTTPTASILVVAGCSAYKEMNAKHPERVLQLAVKRMLPKNRIGRNMLLKVKIYKGDDAPARRPAAGSALAV